MYYLGYGTGNGLGGRITNPVTGTFLSPDPLWLTTGDANRYRYCFNDPVNKIDPSGQQYIIVDSTNKLDAVTAALTAKGIGTAVTPLPNGTYRVAASSSTTNEEVDKIFANVANDDAHRFLRHLLTAIKPDSGTNFVYLGGSVPNDFRVATSDDIDGKTVLKTEPPAVRVTRSGGSGRYISVPGVKTPLRVSNPFQTPFTQEQEKEFAEYLRELYFDRKLKYLGVVGSKKRYQLPEEFGGVTYDVSDKADPEYSFWYNSNPNYNDGEKLMWRQFAQLSSSLLFELSKAAEWYLPNDSLKADYTIETVASTFVGLPFVRAAGPLIPVAASGTAKYGKAALVAADEVFLGGAGQTAIDTGYLVLNRQAVGTAVGTGAATNQVASKMGTSGSTRIPNAAPKNVPGAGHNAANTARLAEDLHAAELANPLIESLQKTGKLPPNYLTKAEATAAGWEPGKAVNPKVPGGQLGGDVFRDPASIGLPTAPGRIWYEADIGLSNTMKRSNQPGTRLLYSNDGKAFVTPDHYERLYQLPDWN